MHANRLPNRSARLKVHLVFESGEDVVEIKEDDVLPGVFFEPGNNSGHDMLLRYLDNKVMSQIRGMLRGQINKFRGEGSYEYPGHQDEVAGTWPDDSGAVEQLEATLAAVFQRRHEGE